MVESGSMEHGPAEHGCLSAWNHRRHRVESRFSSSAGRVSYQVLVQAHPPQPPPDAPLGRDRALRLAHFYFRSVSGLTAGLLKESRRGEGWELTFAAAPCLALLRAGSPKSTYRCSWSKTTYPMVGGILARGHDAGWFTFEVMGPGSGTTLSVRLDRFAPSLLGDGSGRVRRVLYRYTQSSAHRLLLKRFLSRASATGM